MEFKISDRSNVSLMQCFYCMKDYGVAIDRRLRQSLPHRACFDHDPCPECEKLMEQGVILISVDETKSTDRQNPWRTGGFAVVRDEAIERLVKPPELAQRILKVRMAFLPDEVWKALGLPTQRNT